MRRVSMREANQKFSGMIAEVEAGERFIVERRGVAVAEIIPVRKALLDAQREKGIQEYFKMLDKGLPLGGGKAPTKDEMHER